MKLLLVLPIAILLGAASAPPAELRTGRSVAVASPTPRYWLSDDLSRLMLRKTAGRGEAEASDKTRR